MGANMGGFMQKNPVCYWELASHNAEKTTDFLKKVFSWEPEYDEKSGIYEFAAGEEQKAFAGGGVFTLRKAKLPFLTIYMRVKDIEAKAKLVEKHGGFIVEAPFEISPGTKICLFNEPSGVTLAMLEKKG
jgi:predicted enzyme related to lactoylglutathione lyase